jgi:hypothetical protein
MCVWAASAPAGAETIAHADQQLFTSERRCLLVSARAVLWAPTAADASHKHTPRSRPPLTALQPRVFFLLLPFCPTQSVKTTLSFAQRGKYTWYKEGSTAQTKQSQLKEPKFPPF